MRAPATRAASTRRCSNISGVTVPSPAVATGPSSASASRPRSTIATAASSLRVDSGVRRPRAAPSLVAVVIVPPSVAMTGMTTSRPSISRSTCGVSGNPPLRTMPESIGKVLDRCASSTPSTTSSRSPGTITTPPSMSRSSTCGIVIAATTRPVLSRSSHWASPWTSRPSQASIRSLTVGARSSGVSGRACTGTRTLADTEAAVASRSSWSTWLATTPVTWAWTPRAAATAISAMVATSSGSCPWAGTTSSSLEPRFAATAALTENSVGAETSV